MMHQDSLEPAAIRFTLERLQESARRSGYFLLYICIYIRGDLLLPACDRTKAQTIIVITGKKHAKKRSRNRKKFGLGWD